jgi:hypothetical protein
MRAHEETPTRSASVDIRLSTLRMDAASALIAWASARITSLASLSRRTAAARRSASICSQACAERADGFSASRSVRPCRSITTRSRATAASACGLKLLGVERVSLALTRRQIDSPLPLTERAEAAPCDFDDLAPPQPVTPSARSTDIDNPLQSQAPSPGRTLRPLTGFISLTCRRVIGPLPPQVGCSE